MPLKKYDEKLNLSKNRFLKDTNCMSCGVLVEKGSPVVYCASIFWGSGENKQDPVNIALCGSCRTKLVRVCDDCGIRVLSGALISVDDVNVCPWCAEKRGYHICDSCSAMFKGDGHATSDGLVCDNCFKAYDVCSLCGEMGIKQNMVRVYSVVSTPKGKRQYAVGKYVCRKCHTGAQRMIEIFRCIVCKKTYPQEHYVAEMGCCELCAAVLRKERSCKICGERCDTLSNMCSQCSSGRVSYIKNYTYAPEFHPTGSGPLYGMEIETNGYSNKIHVASREIFILSCDEKRIFQKKDGSIGPDGIECCFQPRTMECWYNKSGVKLLSDFREVVSRHGGHSYKTGMCGIHIHRSKNGIDTPLRRVMLGALISSIEPYVYIIAQRTGCCVTTGNAASGYHVGTYGSFNSVKGLFGDAGMGEDNPIEYFKSLQKKKHETERGAINFSTGKPTYEFRVFRGTTNVDTILAYLAFFDLLIDYSAVVSLSSLRKDNPSTAWRKFCKFVQKQDTLWAKRFTEYAQSKGVMQ
jgi:hypothetical protein